MYTIHPTCQYPVSLLSPSLYILHPLIHIVRMSTCTHRNIFLFPRRSNCYCLFSAGSTQTPTLGDQSIDCCLVARSATQAIQNKSTSDGATNSQTLTSPHPPPTPPLATTRVCFTLSLSRHLPSSAPTSVLGYKKSTHDVLSLTKIHLVFFAHFSACWTNSTSWATLEI